MTDLTPEALAILAGADAKPKKGGLVQTVAVVVGLTLIAAAGGTALGMMLGKPQPAAPAAEPAPAPVVNSEAPLAKSANPDAPADVVLALEPVLTDIASPPGTQLRLEASLIVKPEQAGDQAQLASQVQADMIVFVRTLELAQVEGSRGLLHLREDLLERAKMRSPGVIDIMVRSLVVK
ncbi:flagellar basal body-associated FliL family protein [Aureimonas sp. AU12]|uniref:flagellar basal body-associated FliL family protein n=1 Tax=Aureimonas sp. AU12 TaxID=1638161 RepID=UPI000785E971|nr:flagellar basal body-associated FliL family protein [Aureimonas sp. AU12]